MQRTEWMEARHTKAHYGEHEDAYGTKDTALVLHADEAVAITGTPEEILELLDLARAVIQGRPEPRTVGVLVNGLQCPWCGDLDSLQEVGTIIETFLLERVSLANKTVTTGSGRMNWDSYSSDGFECRTCGKPLALPYGWDHEDLS